VSAARINDENTIWRSVYPDAVFLLELCIYAETIFRGIADLEAGCRFEESAGQKESEEGQEPRYQECGDCTLN